MKIDNNSRKTILNAYSKLIEGIDKMPIEDISQSLTDYTAEPSSIIGERCDEAIDTLFDKLRTGDTQAGVELARLACRISNQFKFIHEFTDLIYSVEKLDTTLLDSKSEINSKGRVDEALNELSSYPAELLETVVSNSTLPLASMDIATHTSFQHNWEHNIQNKRIHWLTAQCELLLDHKTLQLASQVIDEVIRESLYWPIVVSAERKLDKNHTPLGLALNHDFNLPDHYSKGRPLDYGSHGPLGFARRVLDTIQTQRSHPVSSHQRELWTKQIINFTDSDGSSEVIDKSIWRKMAVFLPDFNSATLN